MFFIVTTGRSGSTSIAKYLSLQPNCICLHEPKPTFIKYATEYIHGNLEHQTIVDKLKATRRTEIKGREYGESNQKLSFIIPAILDAFSFSKFIWLIRDGRSVVSSIYGLNWYDPRYKHMDEWRQNLPQAPLVGEIYEDQWRSLTVFEKCCWYWSFTNRQIKKELSKIDSARWISLTIEDLNIQKLHEFLNINGREKRIPWINKKRKDNKKLSWANWNNQQKQIFEKVCGKIMDEHYPGWINNNGEWVYNDNLSISLKIKNKIQDIMVDVPGKKSLLYKGISIPIKLVCRKNSEKILNKLDYIYKKISGEY